MDRERPRTTETARTMVLSLLGFLLLAAGFLWEPLLTGNVYLPSDLSFQFDQLWTERGLRRPPGRVAQNPILADVSDYYQPYRAFALAELRNGHFPLWNPFILSGTAFFASAQAAVLDPVNVVTLPSGELASWTWGALLRLALLGWFTFGFARSIGRSTVAAVAAGIVFMLSGIVVVWINYPVVTTLVWMPALFWASTRMVATGSRRSQIATALSIGALLVGGHPETQFLVGLVWGTYTLTALSLLPAPRAASVRQRSTQMAVAVALGAALSAVQWVPFVDLLFRSHAFSARAEPFAPFDALETALRLAVLVLPNLGGSRHERDYWLPAHVTNYNEQTGYVGLLAIALAAIGFRASRRAGGPDARVVMWLGATALAAVALAIRAPGFHLVKKLPLLDVGHGVRWLLMSSFCVALLAACGLDALRSSEPSRVLGRVGTRLAALALAGLAVLVGVWAFVHGLPRSRALTFEVRGQATSVPAGQIAALLDPTHLSAYLPLWFLLSGAVVLVAMHRRVLRPTTGVIALVALLYLDLWSFGSRYNPVTPAADVFPPTPTTEFLSAKLEHERVLAAGDLLRPNVGMVFGFRDLRGYEDLIAGEFAALYGESLARLQPASWMRGELSAADVRLFDIASVRFLLTAEAPRTLADLPYRLAFQSEGVRSYQSTNAIPRAHAVLSARVVPDVGAAREALLDRRFDPQREVVLVGAGVALEGPQAQVPPVEWREDDADVVALEVMLPARGYVVLSDLWSPEWRATLDGEQVDVLRANGVFRAVAVPAGRHEVRFSYRPRLVYVCAGLSVAAAAILTVLALFAMRRD